MKTSLDGDIGGLPKRMNHTTLSHVSNGFSRLTYTLTANMNKESKILLLMYFNMDKSVWEQEKKSGMWQEKESARQ